MSRADPLHDAGCRRCPRLAAHLDRVRQDHADYFAAPVPSFGPVGAPLLIVGLAPGMHGANRTGRPFTGDYAGILLYESLHAHGLASQPQSIAADDGLELRHCRITNAVRCLPPENKPTTAEVRTCNGFLGQELASSGEQVVLALGKIAHDAVLRALSRPLASLKFSHGAEHGIAPGRTLLDCYHCSRYNTQTGRLTATMFHDVIARARDLAA